MEKKEEIQALELHKPKKLIPISSTDLTLVQQKTYNYILRKFFYEAKKDEKGEPLQTVLTFTHSEIQGIIGASETNNKQLYEELKALAEAKVEYVRGNDWGIFHLIAQVEKRENMIEIQLPMRILRELFAKNYVTLDLVKMRPMGSKYTVMMYEWCENFRKESFSIFQVWTIEELKKLLGITEKSTYNRFQEIQSRILKPSIKELEQITGIKMTYELTRKGAKYDTIHFTATYPRKKPTQEQKGANIALERGKAIYSASSKENRINELKTQILKLTKQNEVDPSPSLTDMIANYKKELAKLEPVQAQKLI